MLYSTCTSTDGRDYHQAWAIIPERIRGELRKRLIAELKRLANSAFHVSFRKRDVTVRWRSERPTKRFMVKARAVMQKAEALQTLLDQFPE